MIPSSAQPAVTPEEDEAFAWLALRSALQPVRDGEWPQAMLSALAAFSDARDSLIHLGWKTSMYSAVDGTEAMVLVHQAAGPIKATFCGDWDGSWFAELVDGELTPIQPILFFPIQRVPR